MQMIHVHRFIMLNPNFLSTSTQIPAFTTLPTGTQTPVLAILQILTPATKILPTLNPHL